MGRHGGHHLAGRLLVWMVEAGKPAAVVLVLALRPALQRPLGISLIGVNEIEPAARLAAIANDDVELRALFALTQVERQRLAVVLELQALAIAKRDGDDGHLHRVQRHARRPVVQRRERLRAHALDRAALEVQRHLDLDVLDGAHAVGRPGRARARQRERQRSPRSQRRQPSVFDRITRRQYASRSTRSMHPLSRIDAVSARYYRALSEATGSRRRGVIDHTSLAGRPPPP